jgi:transcription elongation factor GreA
MADSTAGERRRAGSMAAGAARPWKGIMADKRIELTATGLAKIQEELRYLKEERRQELTEYMGAALADGDLRENAAYDEARLLQSANEARIADLEEIVHRAVVVTPPTGDQARARLGARVHLTDEGGQEHVFHLVGSLEADVFANRISDESPLGQALLGRGARDEVKFKTRTFTVTSVAFD